MCQESIRPLDESVEEDGGDDDASAEEPDQLQLLNDEGRNPPLAAHTG
jgi:hypothetical protein